jgi:elongation factor P
MLRSLTFILATSTVGAFVPQGKPSFGLSLHVAVDTSEIKNGMTLNIDNEPYKVLSFSVMKQARGAAKTTIKFKNLVSFLQSNYESSLKT